MAAIKGGEGGGWAGRGLGKCAHDPHKHKPADTEGRGRGGEGYTGWGGTPQLLSQNSLSSLIPHFSSLSHRRNIACLYFMAKLF